MDPRFKNRIDSDEIWYRVKNAAVRVKTHNTTQVQFSLLSQISVLTHQTLYYRFKVSSCRQLSHTLSVEVVLLVVRWPAGLFVSFWTHPCQCFMIKYILQVSKQEESDADDVSEQKDKEPEYSDEVMSST